MKVKFMLDILLLFRDIILLSPQILKLRSSCNALLYLFRPGVIVLVIVGCDTFDGYNFIFGSSNSGECKMKCTGAKYTNRVKSSECDPWIIESNRKQDKV